jgi:DNA-binding beta-propeller fold protein YncE
MGGVNPNAMHYAPTPVGGFLYNPNDPESSSTTFSMQGQPLGRNPPISSLPILQGPLTPLPGQR